MSNPTGNWALECEPAFDMLWSAIQSLSLDAGLAGDELQTVDSLDNAGPAVGIMDASGVKLGEAVAAVRDCPPPPDRGSAAYLAASLADFERMLAFDVKTLTEWTGLWESAIEKLVAFNSAFARANGQQST